MSQAPSPPKNCPTCPSAPYRWLCIRSSGNPKTYRYADGIRAAAGRSVGHANLVLYEGTSGPCGDASKTWGAWPDRTIPNADPTLPGKKIPNGIQEDDFQDKPGLRGANYPFAYCTIISDEQYKKLMKLGSDKTVKWGEIENCSTWASKTFYEVTGVSIDSNLVVTTPGSVSGSIVGLNGGQAAPYCGPP